MPPSPVDPRRAAWINRYRDAFPGSTYHQGRAAYDRAFPDLRSTIELEGFYSTSDSEWIEVGQEYVRHSSRSTYSIPGFVRATGMSEALVRVEYAHTGAFRICGNRDMNSSLHDHRLDNLDAGVAPYQPRPTVPYSDTPDWDDAEDGYYDENDEWVENYRDTDEYDSYDRRGEYRDTENYTRDDPAIPEDTELPRMFLEEIEGRKNRTLSVEQELIKGGSYVARELYDVGLAEGFSIGSYSRSNAGKFLALVKHDGSVESEIVYSRMDLTDRLKAIEFQRGLEIVRSGIGENEVALSEKCGLHIHVDIHGWTMHQVTNLYHLWNFLEKPIYQIAAAHWGSGHRSLSGNTYAPRNPKGCVEPFSIGRALEGCRGALNLQNFLSARRSCDCGAQNFGVWDACTCDKYRMGKTTAEFRVFNTTANLRKMKAYTALCLALVGYAETHECHPDEFTTFEWNVDNYGDTEYDETEDYGGQMIARLKFLLNDLPLTQSEREDLFYCVKNSAIADEVDGWQELNPAQAVLGVGV